MNKITRFIISLVIPLAVGAIAGLATSSSVDGWYTTLQKPSFNPPNAIFAPVWTTLYALMGIAFYFVWISDRTEFKPLAIKVYVAQLMLNFAWSFIFFYFHQVGWALVEIILLWLAIVCTIYFFSKVNKLSAWLMVPYICWVSFATALNFAIWQLN